MYYVAMQRKTVHDIESSSHSFPILLCDLEEVAHCLWVIVCTSVRGDVLADGMDFN